MNNKAKKLISGVLALSIGVSGNGIVGFADEVTAKSTEQTINSETNEVGTNLEQNLSAKDESPTPSTAQEKHKEPTAKECGQEAMIDMIISCLEPAVADYEEFMRVKSEEPAAIEFRPEEITLSVKAVHNPYLEQAVKELNKFIKEYNSKATREGKIAFAVREKRRAYVRYDVFLEEVERGVKGKFLEKLIAEWLKLKYIGCCVSEDPYLSDTMKEIAEIQKIYDSKATDNAKRAFTNEEMDKLILNDAWSRTDCIKFTYLFLLSKALKAKYENKDKNSVWYKVQKVVDNTILLAGKLFIGLEFLYPLVVKFSSSIFANIGNSILCSLLQLSTCTALWTLMYMTLFKPFDFIDACRKFKVSLAKLF